MNVQELAAELIEKILQRKDDPRLKWVNEKNTVEILVNRFFITAGVSVDESTSRRKLLISALESGLTQNGWSKKARTNYIFNKNAG